MTDTRLTDEELAEMVQRDASVPWTASFIGNVSPKREVAWQAIEDRRRLLTEVQQLRRVREALREAAEEAHIYGPDHERRPFDECGYGACSRRRAALRPEEPRPEGDGS